MVRAYLVANAFLTYLFDMLLMNFFFGLVCIVAMMVLSELHDRRMHRKLMQRFDEMLGKDDDQPPTELR